MFEYQVPRLHQSRLAGIALTVGSLNALPNKFSKHVVYVLC